MKPRDDRLNLGPVEEDERAIRSFKARRVYQCPLCQHIIQRGQLTVVTSSLRFAHAGCFIDARNLRDGQEILPFAMPGD